MRVSFCVMLGSTLAACSAPLSDAFPPPVIPARPLASDWPDVGAAVLDDVATMAFEKVQRGNEKPRVVVTIDHRRRLKILTEDGLRHATVVLPIDGFSTVTKVVARSVRPDGSFTRMSAEGPKALKLQGNGGKTGELKNLIFTVPGAVVGGLIEYRYQRVFVDPHMVPVWLLGGPLPRVRSELGIVVDDDLKVDFRFGRGTKVEDRMPLRRRMPDGRERLVFVETDVPAYYREPNMPHHGRIGPWVAVVLTSAKIWGKRSRLETWASVAKRLGEYEARVGGEAGTGSARQRFRTVRELLVPLRLDGVGLRQPVPVAGLERGEPACSRDASAYLLRMLEGSGARAYRAYLTGPTGPAAPQDLPGFYPFTRAVVAVDVSDEIARDPSCRADPVKRGLLCTVPPNSFAFLDPTCDQCRYGELPTELTGGRALVIMEDGPRWVDVPIDPPERNRIMTQLHLALGIDGTIKGGINGELTGAPARRLRRALSKVSRGDERDEVLTIGVVGQGSPVTFLAATYRNAKNVDKPFGFKARIESKVEKVGYDRFIVRPADIAGPVLPGRWRSTRRYDALLEAPSWIETVVALDLPVGYEVDPPPVTTIVEPFAEYAADFVRRERTLTYSRRLVVKQHVIPADQWPEFRRFVRRIADLEQRGVAVRVGDGGE
ncbi:MAG: hypothetical protein V3T05_13080 [Myxococcota bacterium]